MNTAEQTAIIRLPPTTRERKARYMRAAGARKMKLTDWIWETLDRAVEPEEALRDRIESLKSRREKLESRCSDLDPIDQSTHANTDDD